MSKYVYNVLVLIYIFQSYFMGCAFDMFSTSWTARSYVLVLFIVCWFVPLFVIISSYCGIIMRVRSPTVRKLRANSSTRRISKPNLSVRSSRSSKVSFNSTLSDENLKASPRVSNQYDYAILFYHGIFTQEKLCWNHIHTITYSHR